MNFCGLFGYPRELQESEFRSAKKLEADIHYFNFFSVTSSKSTELYFWNAVFSTGFIDVYRTSFMFFEFFCFEFCPR